MLRLATIVLAVIGCGIVIDAKRHQKAHHNKDEWVIYKHQDFEENDLCGVLNCRRTEVCMVRNNNAMCVNKHKINQIAGSKRHFGDHHGSQKHHNPKFTRSANFVEHVKAEQHIQHKPHGKKEFVAKKHHKTNSLSDRHSHEENEQDCSVKELREMGGRLLQWFSDVHNARPNSPVHPLPEHNVRCRQDVGWMFGELDGNENGDLSINELYSIEHDQYESCIKPFLDRCDTDGDDHLSMNEWCDCFHYSDKLERDDPPCHLEQHKVDPHLLGAWVPRCDVDGFYRPEQCHEGQCWCVDRWGREFDHSRVSHHRADCGQYADHSADEDLDETVGSIEEL